MDHSGSVAAELDNSTLFEFWRLNEGLRGDKEIFTYKKRLLDDPECIAQLLHSIDHTFD